MPLFRVIQFIANGSSFTLRDTFTDTFIGATKYYLMSVSTSDVAIKFNFGTYILFNTIVELFINPTTTLNGRLMTGITSINIYADPTVSNDGTQILRSEPGCELIDLYVLTLSANTTYLIKITPKDVNSSTVV